MKYILEFEQFEPFIFDLQILINDFDDPKLLKKYIYENYGPEYLNYDFINELIKNWDDRISAYKKVAKWAYDKKNTFYYIKLSKIR